MKIDRKWLCQKNMKISILYNIIFDIFLLYSDNCQILKNGQSVQNLNSKKVFFLLIN